MAGITLGYCVGIFSDYFLKFYLWFTRNVVSVTINSSQTKTVQNKKGEIIMAKSTVVLKKGRALMANPNKARVFTARFKAEKFARNMIRMSNNLKFKDFEFITMR